MAEGGKVPWQDLLAQFFTGLRKDNYRLLPPNKKHLWRGIYLPSLGVPGPDHIVVAIDTSGSMSDRILSEILGEVDRLRSISQCSMTLIQCDAKIQKVEHSMNGKKPNSNARECSVEVAQACSCV